MEYTCRRIWQDHAGQCPGDDPADDTGVWLCHGDRHVHGDGAVCKDPGPAADLEDLYMDLSRDASVGAAVPGL